MNPDRKLTLYSCARRRFKDTAPCRLVPARSAAANRWQRVRDSFDAGGGTAGDGGDDHDAVAVLEAVGFAAEKADVFLVDIDIDELADAAGVVAEMASHGGEFLLELGKQFGEGCRSAFERRGAVCEAAKGGGDFDDDFHFSALLQLPRGDFLAERFLDCATRHVLRACRQKRRVAPLGMTPKTFISARSSSCRVEIFLQRDSST